MKRTDDPSQQVRLWIHGLTGRMGQAITQCLQEGDHHPYQLLGGSSKSHLSEVLSFGKSVSPETLATVLRRDHPHVIADFSSIEGNKLLLETLLLEPEIKSKVLIGTTGLPAAQLELWQQLSGRLGILFAPNTSIGILQVLRAVKHIAEALDKAEFDIEVIDTHHRLKKDSPSGTALFLAEALGHQLQKQVTKNPEGERVRGSIGVHGIRGGMVIGEHEVRFLSDDEEVTISHRAFKRELFAKGALRLCQWLHKQKPGIYHLEDVCL